MSHESSVKGTKIHYFKTSYHFTSQPHISPQKEPRSHPAIVIPHETLHYSIGHYRKSAIVCTVQRIQLSILLTSCNTKIYANNLNIKWSTALQVTADQDFPFSGFKSQLKNEEVTMCWLTGNSAVSLEH